MTDVRKYYRTRLQKLEKDEKSQKKKLRILGLIRLLTFVSILSAVFVLIPEFIFTGIVLAVLLTIVFFAVVKINNNQSEKHQHLKALIRVNKDELKALDYNFSSFDPGYEYITGTSSLIDS